MGTPSPPMLPLSPLLSSPRTPIPEIAGAAGVFGLIVISFYCRRRNAVVAPAPIIHNQGKRSEFLDGTDWTAGRPAANGASNVAILGGAIRGACCEESAQCRGGLALARAGEPLDA